MRFTIIFLVGLFGLSLMAEAPPHGKEAFLAAHFESVRQADKGDISKQLYINHQLMRIGQTPKYDFNDIVKTLEIQAKNGDIDALYRLAVIVGSNFSGIKTDVARRKQLIEQAALLGQPEAMLEYAKNISQNKHESEKAIDWWLRARSELTRRASSGDQNAMSKLWFLHPPAGIMQNPRVKSIPLFKEGLYWLRRSAEAGDIEAMVSLGSRLTDSPIEQDPEKLKLLSSEGFEWLKKAAENGDGEGMIYLGLAYYRGLPYQWQVEYIKNHGSYHPDLLQAWLWWDKAIGLVGEAKVHEIIAPAEEGWPPRPGDASTTVGSQKAKKRPENYKIDASEESGAETLSVSSEKHKKKLRTGEEGK